MIRAGVIAVVLALSRAAVPAAAAVHQVDQMVVFPAGVARSAHVFPYQTSVRIGRKRCAVAASTPLAALVRSRIGPLSLRDYGACSKRPADGGSLFVSAISNVHNRGSDGWVYKVGQVGRPSAMLGTAGAADPAGPFGHGRLGRGAQVTWFWCHVTKADAGCPHTLSVTVASSPPGTLTVRVKHVDDHGHGAIAAGATVHAGRRSATTGADGLARFSVSRGDHLAVWAEQPGRIRSFRTPVSE